MAQATADTLNAPASVDLSSADAAASREFYGRLFGWEVEVNADPQYGGYGLARIGGQDAAGIGPKMDPNAPTAWNLYIGTDDIEVLARRVGDAVGSVVMAPFDVGDQGRMAVFSGVGLRGPGFPPGPPSTKLTGPVEAGSAPCSNTAPAAFDWACRSQMSMPKVVELGMVPTARCPRGQ